MYGTNISVLLVRKNSLLKRPVEQDESNAHQQITLLQKEVIRYHLQKSYLNFPGGESHFSPSKSLSIICLPHTHANLILLIQMMKLLITQFSALSSYCVSCRNWHTYHAENSLLRHTRSSSFPKEKGVVTNSDMYIYVFLVTYWHKLC